MPASIVVVHDDRSILDPIATALRGEGHDVVSVVRRPHGGAACVMIL
jgi:DNA-binding response OmpR family regulator